MTPLCWEPWIECNLLCHKKEWFLGKEVKRWLTLIDFVVVAAVVVVVGAVGAVTAGRTPESAGVVDAVAPAVDGVAAAR
jgi:hypothetical protein